jgi:cytochrome c-type biogenesis protein CcmE
MLYIQKLMDLVLVLCGALVLAILLYLTATSQEIVFVAVDEDLNDYQVAYRDCLKQNEIFRHLKLVMESEMALCLEERGH